MSDVERSLMLPFSYSEIDPREQIEGDVPEVTDDFERVFYSRLRDKHTVKKASKELDIFYELEDQGLKSKTDNV